MVVGRSVRQEHALDVHDPTGRFELEDLTGQVEAVALAVGPFVADLPAGSALVDAHRHRPAVWAEQPLLDEARLEVCAVNILRRRGEATLDDDDALVFGGEN